MSAEPPERLERRKILMYLEAEITAWPTHELDTSQLKELNIEVQRMVLGGEQDQKPIFFLPYLNFSPPSDEFSSKLCKLLHDEDHCFTDPIDRTYQVQVTISNYATKYAYKRRDDSPWSSKCVDDYTPYKDLYQYKDPEFGAYDMTDISGGEFPHTKALIYNNLEGNDQQILRGELLIILRLMIGQLKKRRFIKHMIAPVLVVSLLGKRGRAIEAYFDGQSLILRCTKLYSFRDQTATALKSLTECYDSDPTGNTF